MAALLLAAVERNRHAEEAVSAAKKAHDVGKALVIAACHSWSLRHSHTRADARIKRRLKVTCYLLLVDDGLLKREALSAPLCTSIKPVLEAVNCCSVDYRLWQFVPM